MAKLRFVLRTESVASYRSVSPGPPPLNPVQLPDTADQPELVHVTDAPPVVPALQLQGREQRDHVVRRSLSG